MSREEIIAMAREAGFVLADNATDEALNRFRAFAALVAAREREACAQVCETEWSTEFEREAGVAFAMEIRARSNHD